MLPFPCPPVDSEVMRTVPNDRVALKKKKSKRQHEGGPGL